MYRGVEIIVSDAALKDSDVRLFPVSRHRSQRIHKKLIKRFGGEFRKVPAIYRIGDRLVAHPVMYQQLMADKRIALRKEATDGE